MQEIMGSVDNAWIKNSKTKVCHLVFMKNSMVECEIVNKKELSGELKGYLKSDPLSGDHGENGQNYAIASENRDEQKKIIEEAEVRGMDMEKSLDSDMKNDPDFFQVYPYDGIEKVSLVQGKSGYSPELLIKTNGKTLNYKLMHNSYDGFGKLDEVTFSKYKAVLRKVFGEKLDMN
jgi:hypothetical protein